MLRASFLPTSRRRGPVSTSSRYWCLAESSASSDQSAALGSSCDLGQAIPPEVHRHKKHQKGAMTCFTSFTGITFYMSQDNHLAILPLISIPRIRSIHNQLPFVLISKKTYWPSGVTIISIIPKFNPSVFTKDKI